MKKLMMVIALGLLYQCIITAKVEPMDNSKQLQSEIIQLEHEWGKANVQKDIPSLRRLIADDYKGIESYGGFNDKAGTIADIESGNDNVEIDDPEQLEVRTYGDTAIVTGKLRLKGYNKRGEYDIQLLFTDVWVKRAGKWQVVNYQGTRTQPESK
jgi:ketosteroid isomerase-like protein